MAKGPYKDLLSDPPAEELAVVDPIRPNCAVWTEGGQIRCNRRRRSFERRQDGHYRWRLRDKPDEQIITLWETETGKERGHFLGHSGRTNSIAISTDGKFVVTGTDDTTALVWDATRPRTRNSSIRQESPAADLAACFKGLASENAERAYASIWGHRRSKRISTQGSNSLLAAADVQNPALIQDGWTCCCSASLR